MGRRSRDRPEVRGRAARRRRTDGMHSLAAVLSLLSLLIGAGASLAQDDAGRKQEPRASRESEGAPLDEEQEKNERIEHLRTLGYIAWDQGANPRLAGVTRHDRGRAAPGYNLYASGSDEVYLMDLDGNRVHTWRLPKGKRACEHAELLRDGTLAVICVRASLTLLDVNSRVLLDLEMPFHHDIAELPDGSLLVPYKTHEVYKYRRVGFDVVATVSRTGEVLGEWSTFENLAQLRKYHPPSDLDTEPGIRHRNLVEFGDYYHLNTVEILPETDLGRSDRRFRAGNILICLRHVNLIAILDQEDHSVVWDWGTEDLQLPHMPTMLPNGRMLVFDNGADRGYSRVLEIDPRTKKVVWEYKADPPTRFFTKGRGSNQRLPNGNTLICESERGRAFEVTPRGEIVWEFWNPELVGHARRRIYRFMRLPPEIIEPLLEKAPGSR